MPSKEKTAKKDILIPVMGPTGSGKSYFINTLLKDNKMRVSTDLHSCTTELDFGHIEEIKGYPTLKDYRIVLIDTPGFDDTFKITKYWKRLPLGSDSRTYKNGAKLGGVIYLHDISMDRLSGTARRNLQLFERLCGDDALRNVVLGTTKWGRDSKNAEKREAQLETVHWKPLIDKGSQVRRFDQGYESAWALIEGIVFNGEKRRLQETVLLIQQELVKQDKVLPQTQAGIGLHDALQQAFDAHNTFLRTLAPPENEQQRAEIKHAQELVENLLRQIQKLKIPLSRKFRRFFAL